MSDIFREIDEELRRENFHKLWQRYGRYVMALAVVAVAATALTVGWREYQARQRQAEGVRYAAALDLVGQGKTKDAESAFAAVAQDAGSGRAMLARFEQASLVAKGGDANAAIGLYDAIAQDGSVGQSYRDLATMLAARLEIARDPKGAAQRLVPLTAPGNPWHASALELSAVADIAAGDKTAARADYQKLADDLDAPQGARARAAEMVQALAQ